MRTLLKAIFALVFGFLVLFTSYFFKLEPEQQQAFSRDIRVVLKEGRLSANLYNNLLGMKNSVNSEGVKSQSAIEVVAEALEPLLDDAHNQVSDASRCFKTKTQVIAEQEQQAVFFWVDENGRKHFSDKKPDVQQIENLSHKYKKALDYFSLTIIDDQAKVTAFANDKIRSDVTQIYHILATGLNIKALRKVDLNVRLFDAQSDFQRYKNSIAPKLNTNSGFYSGRLNEASVYQWPKRFDVTQAVIRHESSHVIMAGLFGVTPTWFNEGLAEYFEKLEVVGQQKKVAVDESNLNTLKKLVLTDQLPPLQSVFIKPADEFYAQENLSINYTMAWAAVHFMLTDNAEAKVFHAITTKLHNNPCSDIDMIAITDKQYPGGFVQFEKAFQQWILKPQHHAHYY